MSVVGCSQADRPGSCTRALGGAGRWHAGSDFSTQTQVSDSYRRAEENPRSHTSAEAAFVQDWELGCYCSGSTEAHAVRQRDAARAAGRLQ